MNGRDVAKTSSNVRSSVTEYLAPGTPGSVELDIGSADHLAPLLGFISDEFPERGRCH